MASFTKNTSNDKQIQHEWNDHSYNFEWSISQVRIFFKELQFNKQQLLTVQKAMGNDCLPSEKQQ